MLENLVFSIDKSSLEGVVRDISLCRDNVPIFSYITSMNETKMKDLLDSGRTFQVSFIAPGENSYRYRIILENSQNARHKVIILSADYIIAFLNCLIRRKLIQNTRSLREIYKVMSALSTSKEEIERYFDLQNSNVANKKEKKESKKMEVKKMFGNLFGKIRGNQFRMSMNGLAVRDNEDRFLAFDLDTISLTDVTEMSFSAEDLIYKMPVGMNQVEIGDLIYTGHDSYAYVIEKKNENTLKVLSTSTKEIKEIVMPKNLFGFNFIVKVLSLAGNLMNFSNVTSDNPFGNMLPLLMMGEDSEMSDMLPLLMLSQNSEMTMNPMMMMAMMLSKKDNNNDMMPFLMMSMINNQNITQ